MIKNYKAGYIIDSIANILDKKKSELNKHIPDEQTELDKINGLLQYVSSFDIQFPYEHKPNFEELNPVLATINNIITRGLPTKAPVKIEECFVNLNLIKKNEKEYEFYFLELSEHNKIDFETIFELLHIIKPQLKIEKDNYGGFPGSLAEWNFLDKTLEKYPFAKQILQSQREFVTITKKLGGGKHVDFSFEFPYLNSHNSTLKKKGVIFEFDGGHHKLKTYKYYDTYRDDAAENADFDTLRQASDQLELDQNIKNQFKNEIFNIFGKNYNKDISKNLIAYTLIFTPLAVARIQKTLIEYFLVHISLFEKDKIKIAIIERDLPCGALAINELQELFKNINGILKEENKLVLPQIELSIFDNKNYVYNEKLHLTIKPKDENYFKENDFDIILDHSILIRSNIYKETNYQNDNAIIIRSSHYSDNSFGNARRVYCADLLQYKPLVTKLDDGSYKAIPELEPYINYFIQNIFRKKEYREGQLPIISRALQQLPVIGLLPTGGGKSLTYQLPAFMQPGLCLIVYHTA